MVTFVLRSPVPSEFDRTCNPLFTKPSLITYIYVCLPYIIKGQEGDESGDRANHLSRPFFIYLSSFFSSLQTFRLYTLCTVVHTL